MIEKGGCELVTFQKFMLVEKKASTLRLSFAVNAVLVLFAAPLGPRKVLHAVAMRGAKTSRHYGLILRCWSKEARHRMAGKRTVQTSDVSSEQSRKERKDESRRVTNACAAERQVAAVSPTWHNWKV